MLIPEHHTVDMTWGPEVQWTAQGVINEDIVSGSVYTEPGYEHQAQFMATLSEGDNLADFVAGRQKLGHPRGGRSSVYDTGGLAIKVFDNQRLDGDVLPGSVPELEANVALTHALEKTDAQVGPWRIRNVKPVAAYVCGQSVAGTIPASGANTLPPAFWLMEKIEPQLYIPPRVGMPRYNDIEQLANEAVHSVGRFGVHRESQENLIMTERPSGLFSRKPGTIFLTGVRAVKRTS
jgi:hypothetical protein